MPAIFRRKMYLHSDIITVSFAKIIRCCLKSWHKRVKNEVYFNFSERQTIRRRQIVAQAREKMSKKPHFFGLFPSALRFAESKSWENLILFYLFTDIFPILPFPAAFSTFFLIFSKKNIINLIIATIKAPKANEPQ